MQKSNGLSAASFVSLLYGQIWCRILHIIWIVGQRDTVRHMQFMKAHNWHTGDLCPFHTTSVSGAEVVCMQSRSSARSLCFSTSSVCHAQLNHDLYCCNKDEYRHFCHIFEHSPLNTVCHVLWCMIWPANSVIRPCPPPISQAYVNNTLYIGLYDKLEPKLCIRKYFQPCQENLCLTCLTFWMRNIHFCHLREVAYARLNWLCYITHVCISL